MNFKYHNYKKDFGGTQEELVRLYLSLGKSLDEMVTLMKPVPRSSIRGRISEIQRTNKDIDSVLVGVPQIES